MREIKFKFLVEQTIDNRFNYAFDISEKEFKEALEEGIKSEEELDEIRSERCYELQKEWDQNHSNEERYTKNKLIIDKAAIYGYGNIIRPYGMEVLDIMQYTGLKDKNGTEIYEGDIVTYSVKGFKKINKTVMTFNEEHGAYLFGIYEGVKMPCGKKTRMNKYTRKSVNNVEVIGNIYENPELLKEGE